MRFDLVVNVMTLHAVQRGRILVMGGGRQWRPLVHVADVARVMGAVLDAPIARVRGRIFNCGSTNLQIRNIAYLVRETLPFRIEIETAADDEDRRDYRVSFDRLSDVIDTSTFRTAQNGIAEIYDALKSGTVEEDPTTNTVNWYKTILKAKSLVDEVTLDGRLL
jgi:nucleoside-diphosphate-sugar epimerase